tara:strand:- start:460 stop:666 length:207 start_codon:yes stop_codon:yes gene_type:complete
MKIRKFKIDEWVLYTPFLPSSVAHTRLKAVVLEVLENDPYYDYKIFIDGKGTITKVREGNLFPCEETT